MLTLRLPQFASLARNCVKRIRALDSQQRSGEGIGYEQACCKEASRPPWHLVCLRFAEPSRASARAESAVSAVGRPRSQPFGCVRSDSKRHRGANRLRGCGGERGAFGSCQCSAGNLHHASSDDLCSSRSDLWHRCLHDLVAGGRCYWDGNVSAPSLPAANANDYVVDVFRVIVFVPPATPSGTVITASITVTGAQPDPKPANNGGTISGPVRHVMVPVPIPSAHQPPITQRPSLRRSTPTAQTKRTPASPPY